MNKWINKASGFIKGDLTKFRVIFSVTSTKKSQFNHSGTTHITTYLDHPLQWFTLNNAAVSLTASLC